MIPVLQYNAVAGQSLNPDELHLVVQHCDLFTGLLLADESRKQLVFWHLNQHTQQDAVASITASMRHLPVNAEQVKRCTVVDFGLDAALLPPGFTQTAGLAEQLLALTQGFPDPGQSVLCTTDEPPVVYAAQTASLEIFRHKLPAHTRWQHVLSVINRQPAAELTTITVTVLLQRFVLSVEQGGKRLLLQQYGYEVPEDILYRVFLAIQQLQLNAEQVSVFLRGLISTGSAAEQLLYQYLPNVQWYEALHYNCMDDENMPATQTLALADILLTCAS